MNPPPPSEQEPSAPILDSLSSLTHSLGSNGGEVRQHSRLADAQSIVGEDLGWVEETLLRVAADGIRPGTDAARHLVERGGKRVRPLAVLLGAACFGDVPEAARELAVVAELLHSATLLHDDVIDDGTERRGAETSRLVFGNAVSVLGGDLLLVHALERTQRVAPDALGSLLATLSELVNGEIVQLRGRRDLDVSEATYERILMGKTASLFRWAAATGGWVGGADVAQRRALGVFGERLGVAFQLVDDVLDYEGERTGKTLYADLLEGKLTLPLVLTLAERPALQVLVQRIHEGDLQPVDEIRDAVLQSDNCRKTRERAERTTREGALALATLPESPARELLSEVAHELTQRGA